MATLEAVDIGTEGTDNTLVIANFSAPTGCGLILSILNSRVASSVSSITYNGATWTQLANVTEDGAGISELFVYATHQGADGAGHDLTITFSAAVSGEITHAIVSAWSGIDVTSTAAMHRTIYTDGTGAGDLNVTVTDSQNSDTVVHCISNWGTDITLTETAAGASPYLNILATALDHAMQYKTATGGNTAMGVTGGQFGIAAAFALVPASGGGSPGAGSDSSGVGMAESSSNLIRVTIIEETS